MKVLETMRQKGVFQLNDGNLKVTIKTCKPNIRKDKNNLQNCIADV